MKPGRAFLLLAGVALFGAIANFDEVNAQASFLDAAGETEQGASQSLQQSAVATYRVATDKPMDATAQERPARVLASSEAGRSNADSLVSGGNPLWELPLNRLSTTRERPIFLPSRRPAAAPPTYVVPVAIRQPAKSPEPERPPVSLIGTVIGTDVQIGIFLEKATHSVIRLRLGEEHQGWVLRLVKAREVTIVKDVDQILTLGPSSGEASAVSRPTVQSLVPNSIGTIPVVNTADYVDEQPLPARGAQRQRH